MTASEAERDFVVGPHLGDILEKTSFDQIYDEHFFFFSATSVDEMARRHGLELVDVERLPVHGGEVRYTLARPGARTRSAAVDELCEEERRRRISDLAVLEDFARRVRVIRDELVELLTRLRAEGTPHRRLRRDREKRHGDQLLRYRSRVGGVRL